MPSSDEFGRVTPLMYDVDTLPAGVPTPEILEPSMRKLVNGESASVLSTEQIESVLPGHPGIDVSVPAILRVQGGKEYWLVATSAKEGYNLDGMFEGTVRHGADGRKTKVSSKNYYLIDPEAVVNDERENASAEQRKKSGALLGGNGFAAISHATDGYKIDLNPAKELGDKELARVLVVESGEVMISNRGQDAVEVITENRAHEDTQGVQVVAMATELIPAPQEHVADAVGGGMDAASVASSEAVSEPSAPAEAPDAQVGDIGSRIEEVAKAQGDIQVHEQVGRLISEGAGDEILSHLSELAQGGADAETIVDTYFEHGLEREVLDKLPQVVSAGVTAASVVDRLARTPEGSQLMTEQLGELRHYVDLHDVMKRLLERGREELVGERLEAFRNSGISGDDITTILLSHNMPLDMVFDHLDALTDDGYDLMPLERLADRGFFEYSDNFERLSNRYPWLAQRSDVHRLLRQYGAYYTLPADDSYGW